MRAEIIIFIIAGVIMYNIYTDGKFFSQLLTYQKYYKMAGIAFFAFMIYYLIRKNPENTKNIITSTNEYIKYLPIDKNTTNVISPILDFTSKHYAPNQPIPSPINDERFLRVSESGKKGTKRSVSETKKKFVAYKQNWKCDQCKKILPAWFEVDHKIRLEHGGSNHIDNLRALCRECHGEKTAIENL